MEKNNEIVIGRKPVRELLEQLEHLDKVWIDQKLTGDYEKEVRKLCREKEIPLTRVPTIKLDKLSKFKNHQGVLAFTTPIQFYKLEDIINQSYELGKSPCILIMDNITDIRNLGAVARTAYWFGIDCIVYSLKQAPPINSAAIKASMGALLSIPVCRVPSIVNALSYLKESGIKLIGSSLLDSQLPGEMDASVPMALILGSEERGISREVEQLCDMLVHIPGTSNIDSLNVSVASGVLLYEIFKQRNNN